MMQEFVDLVIETLKRAEARAPIAVRKLSSCAAIALLSLATNLSVRAADVGDELPGLVATYTSAAGEIADVQVLQNAAMYLPSGQAPTPFIPVGQYTIRWTGNLMLDLRADYTFQADVSGDFKLEVNGAVVLEGSGDGTNPVAGKTVRLTKGANAIVATFHSPAAGDGFARLNWSAKGNFFVPIPLTAMTHAASPDLERFTKLRAGRELMGEFRCVRCHQTTATPDLNMEGPSFEGIGSRRNGEWLAQWIENPKAIRPLARMPQTLKGDKARDDARAIAAYLVSLKDTAASTLKESAPEQADDGRRLFDALHCAACHQSPDSPEQEPGLISLKHVQQKFPPGSLAQFLQKPSAHFAWTRMPDFHLTAEEADNLSAYLRSVAAAPVQEAVSTDAAIIERGKSLVQSSGCLNCHTFKLENSLKAKAFAEIPAGNWEKGCLAKDVVEPQAPRYSFTDEERAALSTFGATGGAALARDVPSEFARRQTQLLRCAECHGKFDGFPKFEILGGKLKPEWSAKFIAGEITERPRPWLFARMPAFTQRAKELAQGMAMLHGFAPQTAAESAIDDEAAKVGQKLVSTQGGLSCINCHGAAKVKPALAFDNNLGPNFAMVSDRLLRPYYYRWLRNPQSIDTGTKMPAFFDQDGKSPLTEVFGGDGDKQSNAIWQYLRLGDKMPPPPGAAAP